MKLLRKDNGVTLTILIVTIIILLILATTATYTGMNTIQNSKLTVFTAEMKIIQSEVNYLQSKIETNGTEKTINGKLLSEKGEEVPETSEIIKMQSNMSTVWNQTVDLSAYRYYSAEGLKNDLGIEEIKQVTPVLINLEEASVISVNGIKYQNKIYYTLDQVPDNFNKVEQQDTSVEQPDFEVTSETTENEMKIILSNIQINSQYVKKYKIQYQAVENASWKTVAENLTGDTYTFTVQAAGKYNIKIIDAKNQESEKKEVEVTEYRQLEADGKWSESKGVNTPKLEGTGLIPIYWDDNGVETKVTAENQDEWYDYSNQKWANAKSQDGSYWVWIPRYAYKITSNLGTSTLGEIEIKFTDVSNKNGDEIYKETYPEVVDNAMTDFVVHPAFTTNIENGGWNNDIEGFWIAKYEAGFQASTTDVENPTQVLNAEDEIKYSDKMYTANNTNYITNAIGQDLSLENYSTQLLSYPVFKPLTYAYNVISTSDSYTISKEIKNAKSFYGLSNVDSHLEKNSEWGAVAYLAQSIYGRNGSQITINSKNLNNLNSKNIYTITGYSEDTPNGIKASSTNNMSGVFDLSGGVWERTSGFILNGNEKMLAYGKILLENAGVSYDETSITIGTGKSTKYITIYPYDSLDDSSAGNWWAYKNMQTSTYGFGDAVLETSTTEGGEISWNMNAFKFPNNFELLWTYGGDYLSEDAAGGFVFSATSGEPNNNNGFRVVLINE